MKCANLLYELSQSFKNKNLLRQALTHRSFLNENCNWPVGHNERLEFLGDSVLELIVTEELFDRYPDREEGWMSNLRSALVNYQTLATIGREIGINEAIRISRGESNDTGRARDVILANAVEAVIGAIYKDAGYEAAKNFVRKFVTSRLDTIIRNSLYVDAKSNLQEKVQGELRVTPKYNVLRESGPEHDKWFIAGVFFGETLIAEGHGPSKKLAEQKAAEAALILKGWSQSPR